MLLEQRGQTLLPAMLSSFLLSQSPMKKGNADVDNDLDAIFATSAKSRPLALSKDEAQPGLEPTLKKRKRKHDSEAAVLIRKKQKPNGKDRASTFNEPGSAPFQEIEDITMSTTEPPKEMANQKASKKSHGEAIGTASLDDLEERYSKQRIAESFSKEKKKVSTDPASETAPQRAPATLAREKDKTTEDNESSEDDVDATNLVHESISGKGPFTRRKSVYVPEGETKEQRDERTLFIGNLPSGILKSKPLQKALKRHILSFTPGYPESGTKIESIRFRSVAFKTPTNPQALKDDSSLPTSSRKQDRAFSWRIGKEGEAGVEAPPPKVYLSPAEKKRVAFIKGDFHEQAASVNAYSVFAYHDPSRFLQATTSEVLAPSEIATVVLERMNGTQFEGRTLRVDQVATPNSSHGDVVPRDPASTLFVGNLEFTAHDEDLRTFFETLLTAEMGPPRHGHDPTAESNELSSEERVPHWVSDVRIIRDKDTQLGKGFGYVRFMERTCVDEVVAMEPTKLKFAKRKLRVTRCKAPGDKSSSLAKRNGQQNATTVGDGASPTKSGPTKVSKPKGDPLLGERLKGMSKEERREAKKQDANRLARRMEKKKARLVLEKGLKKPEKERIRVRKLATVKTTHKKSRPVKRTPA